MNKINDYSDRERKLQVQKQIFPTITKKTFIGLCGPNVVEYLEKIEYQRFKRVTLYETNKTIYNKIVKALGKKYPKVRVFNDNINNHLGRTKAFYDLDYCKSFEDIRDLMPKIVKIEEFVLTVSYRPFGFPFGAFRSYLGHNAFRHWGYRDGNPMISLSISKQKWS